MSNNLPPGVTQADIDCYFGADDECCHDEHEVNYEGRAVCDRCAATWWASADEIRAQQRRVAEFDRWCRHEARREFWRNLAYPIRWPLYRLLQRVWPRRSAPVLTDDEIPF